MINKKQSYGFSLVELLVAMAVGLIIVSGAFGLHSGTRKTQAINEMQMNMVADARFAIEMIAYDLRHAGMWGGTNKDSLIDCKSTDTACTSTATGDAPPSSVAGDCAVGWYYDLSLPVFATDGSAGNPYAATCIPGSEQYMAGTDLLEIRYADSNVPAALLGGQAYIRSNFINGRIFIGSPAPIIPSYDPNPLTLNHELHAYVYYISDYTDAIGDGIPSLRRVALVNGPQLQNQMLASGVTDLQVQFGEDVNNDQLIDRYVDPDDVTDWASVYAAKVWLLLRSDERQLGVDTAKSFSMAGAPAVTYGGQDDYRYFMVTSVVNLRNLRQL
ncbi:MAG: PilW family protein [Gammaproteobacteria bacterium]|nr:PilW family protein [Gammaproteobacteria bacterium]MBT8134027.1 PilW family protein [Gammaproteobacteria bacterium]NNJ50007.1 prepilin-type N-terminal cleavage/methylation domain-containing protein [Gammaproteobacteria bacterium]